MSMSQSEYLRRLMEEKPRYIARAKVRDQSELTQINQAKASGNVFQRQKGSSDAYSMSKTYGPTDHAVHANINNDLTDVCCKTYVASGSETDSGSTGILQAAQKCAVCSDPDPAFYPGITTSCCAYDRSLPPFAQKLPGTAQPSCKVCKTTYFNAQPTCSCTNNPVSYKTSEFDKRYGDAGYPTNGS